MVKKKFHGLSGFLFGLFYFLLFVCLFTTVSQANDENTPNTSLDDTWLSAESILKILEGLKIETANSGELCFLEFYTGESKLYDLVPDSWINTAFNFSTSFNAWFHNYYYNYDVTIGDLVFYWPVSVNSSTSFLASNTITIFINSSSSLLVSNFIPFAEFYSSDISYSGGYKTFYRFNSWTYDSNNNISGYITQQPSNNCFVLGEHSVTVNNYGNTPNTYVRYLVDSFYVFGTGSVYSTTICSLSFNNETQFNHHIAYKYYFRIPSSSSNQTAYSLGYIDRIININSSDVTPTPTPTGSGVPVPTGGGQDLSNIDSNVSGINNFLNESGDSESWGTIDSGEIIGVLFPSGDSFPFDNAFANLYNSLIDVLTFVEGYNYLEIDFLGKTYRIWASDFYYNYPPILAQLIPGVFILGVCFSILKYLHHIYFLIQTLKTSGFSSYAEDDMSHLM